MHVLAVGVVSIGPACLSRFALILGELALLLCDNSLFLRRRFDALALDGIWRIDATDIDGSKRNWNTGLRNNGSCSCFNLLANNIRRRLIDGHLLHVALLYGIAHGVLNRLVEIAVPESPNTWLAGCIRAAVCAKLANQHNRIGHAESQHNVEADWNAAFRHHVVEFHVDALRQHIDIEMVAGDGSEGQAGRNGRVVNAAMPKNQRMFDPDGFVPGIG